MNHALDDAREKLKRARSHLANLKRQATQLGRDASRHRVLAEYDSDEECYVVYSRWKPGPLPNLSLVLGDIVHNARGALDFTAWQLAKNKLRREPTEDEARSIQFPITADIHKFNKARLWPLVSPEAKREMLRHQPHTGCAAGNRRLAVLQSVSNRDKHRFVVPLFAQVTVDPLPNYTFTPEPPRGTVKKFTLLEWPRPDKGTEISYKGDPTTVRLGQVTLTPRPPATVIEIDPQPPLDVIFRYGDNALSVPDLKAVLERVEFVVDGFERFLYLPA